MTTGSSLVLLLLMLGRLVGLAYFSRQGDCLRRSWSGVWDLQFSDQDIFIGNRSLYSLFPSTKEGLKSLSSSEPCVPVTRKLSGKNRESVAILADVSPIQNSDHVLPAQTQFFGRILVVIYLLESNRALDSWEGLKASL